MLVLVLNCGSSSIKYQLLEMPAGAALARGLIERVGTDRAKLTHEVTGRPAYVFEEPVLEHSAGIEMMLWALTAAEGGPLASLDAVDAVGHRVVHGGERYSESVLATPEVLADVAALAELAPLHNPANLAGLVACQEALPGRPQVCVFDSGLHQTLAPEVYTYALPYEYYERHRIRRYGFHGLAFRSAFERAEAVLGEKVEGLKIVTLMMGSGNTANAYERGRSVEVSTGFTPHEGLVQSTRAGDVDAAVIPYLMEKEGLTPAQVTEVLNKRSGWSGVSGIGQDLRDILAAAGEGDSRARLALGVHAHRARKYVGAYAAAMGGIDLLIFAGSVGEKAPGIRQSICQGLGFMGVLLDEGRNRMASGEGVISMDDSPARIVVVQVNEELVIARDTVDVMERQRQGNGG
jgi:acetate kinase